MGKGGKGKGKKGKEVEPTKPKDAFDGIKATEVSAADEQRSKGKPGEKGKGKGKKGKRMNHMKKKKRKQMMLEALQDVDFDVPKMSERTVVQGRMETAKLEEMRAQAIKRKEVMKADTDAADFQRKYKCAVNVTGIRNTTEADWEVFMAILVTKPGTAAVKTTKIKNKYAYSKSLSVKAGGTKMFKEAEKVYSQNFEGSYKDLKRQEIRIDLWVVVSDNFNQHLGVAIKNLYEAGRQPVYQTVPIKMYRNVNTAVDGGVLYLNAIVSEVFKTAIDCSNWQYQSPPDKVDRERRSLTFEVPSGNGAKDRHETDRCYGPRYTWQDCGSFYYVGTKIALRCECMTVEVSGVGKAIINLAGAGDFPIATGAVKKMTTNIAEFEQGRVGGAISIKSRSLLLEDELVDSDPSIPAPEQPVTSIIMYNLDPNIQYLCVDVIGAEGLPLGDQDLGTSNPFVRVRYDGMAQSSGVIEGTIRPVWNHNFFIPMRYIERQILSNPRFFGTLLPAEIKSKGYLEVEVWHMDGVPTEFLGAYRLDLRLTRLGIEEERSVCQKLANLTAKDDDEQEEADSDEGRFDEDEEQTFGVDQKLMKKHKTMVYKCVRGKLAGSRIQCQTVPKITFECAFIPDFPQYFEFPEQESGEGFAAHFIQINENWDAKFKLHNERYEAWFPDGPRNRRFMNAYADARGDLLPLPMLVRTLALPVSLSNPGSVMHWVRCFEFTVAAKQKGKGQISGWQPAEAILALRKGPTQDHAVLLCCALLGLQKDAWVAKGTLRGGNEHVWCLSREPGGYVTFWETATGAKYHLPGRWANDPTHGPPSMEAANSRWSKRKVIPDWQEEALVRAEVGRRQQLRDIENLTRLPFSPFMELSTPDKVVPLPYESIEVVFNDKQLYANLTNHHPSCIYYDMEQDPRSWDPYFGPREIILVSGMKDSSVAIPVGPSVSDHVATQISMSIETEVKESIRMTRMRKGFETAFDESEMLKEVLLQFLENLEREITLDIDWMYDEAGKAQKPPGHPSPFNSKTYVDQCEEAWKVYWAEKTRLENAKIFLPIKTNHVMSAVPFHFSGTDLKEIRYHLMDCKPVFEYMNLQSDDNVYFVCAKIFPMANSAASVWCWIGVQMPIPVDEVFALSMKE